MARPFPLTRNAEHRKEVHTAHKIYNISKFSFFFILFFPFGDFILFNYNIPQTWSPSLRMELCTPQYYIYWVNLGLNLQFYPILMLIWHISSMGSVQKVLIAQEWSFGM